MILESGSCRERFSTIVPSKAQAARSMAIGKGARRLKRIENEVWTEAEKPKNGYSIFQFPLPEINSNGLNPLGLSKIWPIAKNP